jgi:hypothetical protein
MRGRLITSSLLVTLTAAALVAGPGHAEESAGCVSPGTERSTSPSGMSSAWWAQFLGSLPIAGSPPNGITNDSVPSRADWTAQSDQVGAEFGFSVGTAGDVNGDGFDDVIVGLVLRQRPDQ